MSATQAKTGFEEIFVGGCEIGEWLRSQDWAQTCLGAVETWPQSLTTALNILFHTDCPMFLVWGRDRILFYNDAYSSVLRVVGQSLSDTSGLFGQAMQGNAPSDWSQLHPEIEQVFTTGRSIRCENQPGSTHQSIFPQASGYFSHTWFYSPLWDEAGQIGGVFATGYGVVAPPSSQLDSPTPPLSPEFQLPQESQPPQESLTTHQEELLRLITNALPVLIAYVDKDHYYRFNSQTYETWFGHPTDTITGQHVRDVLGEAVYQSILPQIEQALAGQSVSYESQLSYQDGGTRYIRADYIPHITPQGQVEGFFSLVSDISDRKRAESDRALAEAALRESEEDFRAMFNVIRVGIAQTDAKNRRFLRVNAAFCNITGYTEAELLTLTVDDINHPDDRDRDQDRFSRLLHGETTSYHAEKRYRRKDGRTVWVLVTGNLIRDAAGQPDRTIAIIKDITERKQTETILRQSEERFRLVTHAVDGLVFDWNLQTNEVYRSEKLYDLVGISPEDAPPGPDWWRDRMHPDDLTRMLPRVAELFASEKQLYSTEYRIRHQDGHWVDVWEQGCLIRDEQGLITRIVGCTVDISDRKRTEAQRQQAELALREKEQQLQQLSDSMPQFVWICSATGELEYVNQQWLEFSGVTLEQTQDHDRLATVYHPDDRQPTYDQWAIALETRQTFEMEARLRRSADGQYRWFLIRAVPGFNEQGQVLRWYGTSTDIHERKRRELHDQFLNQLELRLRQLPDPATMVWETISRLGEYLEVDRCLLAEVDAQRGIVTVDRDWCRDVPSHAGVYALADFITPEFQAAVAAGEPAVVSDVAIDPRTAAFASNFEQIQIKSLLTISCIHQGEWVALLSVNSKTARDWHADEVALLQEVVARLWSLIEQVRATQSLRESDRRFRRLVESNLFGVAFGDFAGNFQYVNDYFTNMVGYSREEIETGQVRWKDITPAEFLHLDEAAAIELRHAGVATPFEKEYIRKDGSRVPVLIGAVLLQEPYDQQQEIICFYIDLTKQKQAEAERERLLQQTQTAREEAENANRIKDEFLAVLSHELRSPLNPILGWTKLLQTRQFDAAGTRKALQTIERNAKLQTQLIEDLLDVSRILRGKMVFKAAPVNLVTIVESALETVRLAAEVKGIQIQTTMTVNTAQVFGDSARLQQIVWNLLSNAVKFTPDGGQVEICLSQIGSDAQIQVKDTGKGISPDFLPYVFDYFRQEDGKTTRKFGGLGLGLAIVRHLAELHGGSVQADSPGEEQGATFSVRFPLMKSTVNRLNENSSSPQSTPLDCLNILLVDDNQDMRDLMQVVLEQQGMQVRIATSATEALKLFDRYPPDVLISDIEMPEIDGYTLMQQIRRRSPDQGGLVPAIALTAYAGEYDQQHALEVGFQRHVAKPVEPEELVRAIAELVQK